MERNFTLLAKDAIDIFDEKFKNRKSMPWQKNIDQMCQSIVFENNYKLFISLIKNITVKCYTTKKTQDQMELLIDAIFFDTKRIYFLYVLLLEMVEYFEEIKVTFSVIYNHEAYRAAQLEDYFNQCIDLMAITETSKENRVEDLDKFSDQIGIENLLNLHKNTKSITSGLTGIEKSRSFRVNKSTDSVSYDIKVIKSDETKRIHCPVCKSYRDYCIKNGKNSISFMKKLTKKNKDTLFFSKKNKIIFNCDHEKTPKYREIPIEIDLKEYKKEIKTRGLKEKDFVIYNYDYFFVKFMEGLEFEW